jgi:hypothetical protein
MRECEVQIPGATFYICTTYPVNAVNTRVERQTIRKSQRKMAEEIERPGSLKVSFLVKDLFGCVSPAICSHRGTN